MNRIAVVTGASRGLGRNAALSIARHGSDVVVTYRSRDDDARTIVADIRAMGRKALALQLDTGDTASFGSSPSACGRRCATPGSARRSITS